jgi:hypothetical protein
MFFNQYTFDNPILKTSKRLITYIVCLKKENLLIKLDD